ncbi:MAG: triose-phosphate isomerase [Gammaproteobacteria bacterium]|nr:triose-phosphate isomerase [Gammaproteobacteria bacterium]
MRQPFVAGNWKMNGSRDSAKSLVEGVVAGVQGLGAEVAVCPPCVYLEQVGRLVDGSAVKLGAQNMAKEEPGAFTGEVAGAMLRDMGCHYVILGHSERRSLYGEDDAVVAAKTGRALADGLSPIVCVGELLDERQTGTTEVVIGRQLDAVLDAVGAAGIARGVIAYEPVWAIGTGMTATPEQAQEVHAFIRARVAKHDTGVAAGLRILYGGSVKGDNAEGLFGQPDIDGGLIGGASLKVDDFVAICRAAD